ncbi:polyprenol monophosphomannose synthase [Arthrobacter castelli]|uniref:polyprenol monophosphomannose synthase n=1 Tax=Arthrobacter castelli TaxID=271431 RepID=UPI00047B3334|nr:polyprenol monophosphomannose synthase [Arthrobacter castelli]
MRVVTIIPTYNEIESLQQTITRLRSSVPESDILVIDDNSPDGTGELAATLAASDSRIHTIHRQGKEGLGAAYLAGFRWAEDAGYDVMVEMDADGSHQPEQLPQLLEAVEAGVDLAIGSRWVPGGRVVNWPLPRKLLSRAGCMYSKLVLRTSVRDMTGGFRAFRRQTLAMLDLSAVESVGYCFQVDLAWKVSQLGLRITEVPITFVEREYGNSKMSGRIIVESMLRITQWGLVTHGKLLRRLLRGPDRRVKR